MITNPLCTLNMLYCSETQSVFFRKEIEGIGGGSEGNERERGSDEKRTGSGEAAVTAAPR